MCGVLALIVIVIIGSFKGFHRIEEGYVGVYYRFGQLQDSITTPGFHFSIPFATQFVPVQVSIQTDSVENIPCGTSGGVMIQFAKIEVVNRLKQSHVIETIRNYSSNYDKLWIYDKIHHEINQFCS